MSTAEESGEAIERTNRTNAAHYEWREPFLQAFAMTANVRAACMEAGVGRATVYRHRDADPEFAKAWAAAEAEAADRIHQEMIRRGVAGVERPVFGPTYDENGKRNGTAVVGHVTEYSDRLLERLAEAHMPDRFGVRRHEVRTGALDPQDDVDARILARLAELQQLALEQGRPLPQIIDVEAVAKDPEAEPAESVESPEEQDGEQGEEPT